MVSKVEGRVPIDPLPPHYAVVWLFFTLCLLGLTQSIQDLQLRKSAKLSIVCRCKTLVFLLTGIRACLHEGGYPHRNAYLPKGPEHITLYIQREIPETISSYLSYPVAISHRTVTRANWSGERSIGISVSSSNWQFFSPFFFKKALKTLSFIQADYLPSRIYCFVG